jgi:hypothetical protein
MLAEGVFIFTPAGTSVVRCSLSPSRIPLRQVNSTYSTSPGGVVRCSVQHTMGGAAPMVEAAPAPEGRDGFELEAAAPVQGSFRELPPVPNMPVPGSVPLPTHRGFYQQGGESPMLLASDPYSSVQSRLR